MRFTRSPLIAAVAAVLVSSPSLMAQQGKGLDSLSDEPLVQELARYGMDSLLERYFQTHQTSAEQQASVRAMMSIRTLLASGDKMPAGQRQQIVRRIVQGADTIVPTLRDPRQLMQLASALISSGMERNANTIEYWGENPRTQMELRPVAELVASVLDQCAKQAREQANKVVEGFGNSPTPAQQKEYTDLDNLATTAQYSRHMADYYRAMSYPKGSEKRTQIADAAIEGLAEFDATDSQVQPVVRLRLGKLAMVKGDYRGAKKTLMSVATNPDEEIEPAPDVLQQYEGRYFATVCDLLAGDVDETVKSIASLADWQGKSLPQDKGIRDGAGASLAMLNYRLELLRADKAADATAKKAAEAKATAVLQQLAQDRPELRGVIFEQLVKSVPEDAPAKGLDTMMLKAIVQQGVGEQMKSDPATMDKKVMERAVDACREVMARTGQPGTDADIVDDVSIVLPQLLEKLGNDVEAAKAYLGYVQASKNSVNRPASMQNALATIGRLKQADAQSAEADQLLDRALPLAVNEFGHRELAYDLGRRLERQGKYAEAIAAYEMVPQNDNRALAARFFRMQAMKRQLDTAGPGLESGQRQTQTAQLAKTADELRKSAAAARASASAAGDKNRFGLIEAKATLMSATLAKETEPARAVQVLEGFESSIANLPGSDDLEAEALFLRIHSLMAMGQNTQATESLLQLLQTKAGDKGAAIIFSLLTKLDSDLETARAAKDPVKVKSLLDARAALSGPLVDWARSNKDERIRKYAYQYMVFDAATKQQAALAEPDVQKRVAGLRQALALYDKLLSGEGIKMWAATVDPQKVDVNFGDVTVLFTKAQVLYELAEYKEAAARFGKLLEERKLGMPRIIAVVDGEMTSEDNPKYWEATLKLYRSNVELANSPATPNGGKLLEDTKKGLKRLYIREGAAVGGEKWNDDFEKLRQEIIPDFVTEK